MLVGAVRSDKALVLSSLVAYRTGLVQAAHQEQYHGNLLSLSCHVRCDAGKPSLTPASLGDPATPATPSKGGR